MRKTLLEERPAFPEEIEKRIGRAQVYDSSCGENARVYYADNGLYVKTAVKDSLAHEAQMGRQFAARKLGPEVLLYWTDEKDWLVTREVPGQDLTHFLDKPELLCRQMGFVLRLLHDQKTVDAPEAPTFALYREGVKRGISEANFQKYVLLDSFGIRTHEEAFRLAKEGLSTLRQDVLIHGDACLPNMMMEKEQITSFIDFACSGAGDRHIDLFWAIWSLSFNLKTEAYTTAFLDAYGRDKVDEQKLRIVAALEALG